MASETMDRLIVRGRELLDAGDYLEARILFTQIIFSDPYNLALWNYRASAHLKLGYPELSFADAARCLKLIDDKLPHTKTTDNDYAGLVLMKIDALYSCFLAAEGLNCLSAMLHYIERLLKNAHLLQDDVRQKLLDKQIECKNTIDETTNRFKSKNIPFDPKRISDLGTMHVVVYPWDDFEPFRHEDSQTLLKKINTTFESLAPKLLVVSMPENPCHYNHKSETDTVSSKEKRPQLGIVTRKAVKSKETILCESGILVNNGLYGPKCNYCNIVLSDMTSKPKEITKSTCRQCGERFCSVECYQTALSSYHKAICSKDLSVIKSYVARGVSCSSLQHLIVLRILAMALQNNQHPLEIAGVKYLTFGANETTSWDIYRSHAFYLELMKALGICPYRDIDRFDFWVYYTLSNKLICNIFGEYAAPQKPANANLFLFTSFFNHSCRPNAKYLNDIHARQSIIALEAIEKNQQVFISYCDTNLPVFQRQILFQTTFGFVCKGDRCVSELGTDNEEQIRRKTTAWQSRA